MTVTQGNPECVFKMMEIWQTSSLATKGMVPTRKMPLGYQKAIRCEEVLQGASPVPKAVHEQPCADCQKDSPKKVILPTQ